MQHALKILVLGTDEQWREIRDPDPARDKAIWYVFADRDAVMHPQLATVIRTREAERPEVDIFYGDEVIAGGSGKPWQYLCKPSFDQTQFLAQDYIGLPLAVKSRAMATLGNLEGGAGAIQCYDMLLRAIAAGIGIERITEVLAVHPTQSYRSSADDRLTALRRAMPRDYPGCEIVPGLTDTSLELRRQFDDYPNVTVVIPTNQAPYHSDRAEGSGQPMVLTLLEGLAQSDWPMDRVQVLIGDDREDGSIYDTRSWPFHLQRMITPRPPEEVFNYAKKINLMWRAVKTEYLIILNDDIKVRHPRWIRALMTFAVDEGVGGVGARLLFPDDTIQHAGMPLGVMGPCTHAFISMPASKPTYQDWALVHREWSAVTGAVFATRRSVLAQVNGFDERFSLNYNDTDLCLRLRSLGYRIIYTPHAELTHFESVSRGKEKSPADQTALFMEKWQDYLHNDPSYHPKLTRDTSNIHPVLEGKEWWRSVANQRR
jgi:O-antigen biosynthesis protein